MARKNKMFIKLLIFLVIWSLVLSPLGFYNNANATLRATPTWYDSNNVGTTPDWHYRVPVQVPASTVIGSTVEVDVNFNSLLTIMGVSGTIDLNSPRVLRPSGVLSTNQEFNQTIYAGATNATVGQGNIRFLAEDAGSNTYYIYFDITQNGTKPVNPQTPIGGTFEQGTNGASTPPGWNAPTLGNATFDAQVRPSESVSVTSDGTMGGTAASTIITDGTSYIGANTYLLGARTNIEPNGFSGVGVTFTKTIKVPATNPGNLVFRYRIEGWDSAINANTTSYDYFQAQIIGSTTTTMVGPSLSNYTTYPFSGNYGSNIVTTTASGYGQYNGFDTDLGGNHHNGMTIANGSQPWFTVTQSLAAFAGQTITLSFLTHHVFLYKTWVSISDVEWSVVIGTLGNPQGFGIQTTYPTAGTNLMAGSTMSITAQVDAMSSTYVTAAIFNPSGVQMSGTIRLYNDGTHGSNVSTPWLWTNNGTDSTNPTYTIPTTTLTSTTWLVRAYGNDGSTSTLGFPNGLIHQSGAPSTPYNSANYYDIGENNFQVTGIASFTNLKTVSMLSDPINGTINPKAIPGSFILYNILVTNQGGGSADNGSIVITDAIPANIKIYVGDLGTVGSGPIAFIDGSPSSGLSYTYAGLGNASTNVVFSNNNGITWTYIPTLDSNGCDINVTNIKITLKGTMNISNGTTNPNLSLQFKAMIK